MALSPTEERNQIQRTLVEIDRKMAEEVEAAGSRTPRLRVKDHSFPWLIWILTALCFGWFAFGGMIAPVASIHAQYGVWGLWAGCLGLLIAAIKTFIWAGRKMKSKFRKPSGTQEESERLRDLRQEKRQLMERLDELKKLER